MKFEIGSKTYIAESNQIMREVTVVKRCGDLKKMQKRAWKKLDGQEKIQFLYDYSH